MRIRRRGRRPVSRRRQEERRRIVRRRMLIAAGVLLLAGAAMTPQLRGSLVQMAQQGVFAVQTLALTQEAQMEVTLPEMTVYALQLGVYDNGEHALNRQKQLEEEGVLSVIWQRSQMRLVCDAVQRKGALSADAANGAEAWVISEELPEIVLRVSAQEGELEEVSGLLTLPDALFARLCDQAPLSALISGAREQAQAALSAHPEHELYAQLAQSLAGWCTLMEETAQAQGEAAARSYARVTMCTLCYELRQTLLADAAQSASSTASAQRTPSTAAEVMPPA